MTSGEHSVTETRPLTFTERARRTQLIEVTIALVAQYGYQKVSLARIAEAAEITKAAVLYHFSSKDALVQTAYERVLDDLVSDVAPVVADSGVDDAPMVYVAAVIRHFSEHPQHTRVIIEALGHNDEADQANEMRWRTLKDLLEAAMAARGVASLDAGSLALIFNGAMDSIVSAQMRDPLFNTTGALEALISVMEVVLAAPEEGLGS